MGFSLWGGSMSKANEEFERYKAEALANFPDKKDEINLCSTVTELYSVLQPEGDENKDDNGKEPKKKSLGVVEHIHKIIEDKKEDEDGEGGESLGKKGSDSVWLKDWDKKPPTIDPTERNMQGRGSKIVSAIYDEIEKLTFKRHHRGGLTQKEVVRLAVLELKRNKLLRSLKEGELSRDKPTKFSVWRCPICGEMATGKVCETCNYRFGTKVSEEDKEKWLLMRRK